jgi:hypothetical protein
LDGKEMLRVLFACLHLAEFAYNSLIDFFHAARRWCPLQTQDALAKSYIAYIWDALQRASLMIMYSIKFPSSDHSVESQSCKLQLLN